MKRLAFALISLLISGAALAQDQVTPVVPFSTPPPLVSVTPEPNDARSAACYASSSSGFVPYVVRPGDQLTDLAAAQGALTVTQLAVLNCLDDPAALPAGAVIWLPALPEIEGIEATETPASEGTAEATAEATPEAGAPDAVIQSFTAAANAIVNTESVTLRWQASGEAAYFYLCSVEECTRPANAQPQPLSGSLTFDGFQSEGLYRYRLEVTGAGGPVTRDVTLDVSCSQEWLGGGGASPLCPQDPARNVFAVWQPFEHGVMLWFSDTQQIYVMTDDGRFSIYEDNYVEGQPELGDVSLEGLLTPVRGFGQIWNGLGGPESAIGWATTNEVGYDGARQAAGRTSYTTYIQGPGSNVYAVTLIPGMEQGYWAQVAW